jgi:hypothetical protein
VWREQRGRARKHSKSVARFFGGTVFVLPLYWFLAVAGPFASICYILLMVTHHRALALIALLLGSFAFVASGGVVNQIGQLLWACQDSPLHSLTTCVDLLPREIPVMYGGAFVYMFLQVPKVSNGMALCSHELARRSGWLSCTFTLSRVTLSATRLDKSVACPRRPPRAFLFTVCCVCLSTRHRSYVSYNVTVERAHTGCAICHRVERVEHVTCRRLLHRHMRRLTELRFQRDKRSGQW